MLEPFLDRGARLTINTDGPYLLDTDMHRELALLKTHSVLTDSQIDQCLLWAREASFLEPA